MYRTVKFGTKGLLGHLIQMLAIADRRKLPQRLYSPINLRTRQLIGMIVFLLPKLRTVPGSIKMCSWRISMKHESENSHTTQSGG